MKTVQVKIWHGKQFVIVPMRLGAYGDAATKSELIAYAKWKYSATKVEVLS